MPQFMQCTTPDDEGYLVNLDNVDKVVFEHSLAWTTANSTATWRVDTVATLISNGKTLGVDLAGTTLGPEGPDDSIEGTEAIAEEKYLAHLNKVGGN